MDFSSLDIPAILAAAVAAFVVGFLWHGPLFGKMWMKLAGVTQAEMDAAKAKGMSAMVHLMVAAFVQQLVVAAVTAHLLAALAITDYVTATLLAVLLWFGYIATTHLNQVLWEKKTVHLYLFNMVYLLVSLIVTVEVVLWMS